MDKERACVINCELFGRLAADFEASVVPRWQPVYDSLVERAGGRPGSVVLDAGTGTGEVALRMARRTGPRGKVVAIDNQPEMLKIARAKAKAQGFENIEFRQASLEGSGLPYGRFDQVVGNYSLCCVLDYEAALKECLRVLKPGGKLMYNHNGPNDPPESQFIFELFERYQVKNPSKKLKEVREGDAFQTEAVKKYRDPFLTLEAMRSLGYGNAEAAIVQRSIAYSTPMEFVDRMLTFEWRSEVDEMSKSSVARFRDEAVRALARFSDGPSFPVKDEMVFFSGTKGQA